MRPGEFKILAALMNEPDGLTYTQLKKMTELSAPVLSEYLAGFVREGIILKDYENKLYFLASAYQSRHSLGDLERSLSIFMRNIPFEGSRIAQVRDQDLRKKIYEDFFSFHMNNISILLVMAIKNSFIQVFKDSLGKEDFWKKMQTLKKKDVKRLAEQTVRRWEAEVTQYHSMIQEKMLNWVIPYIQMLALANMANPQYTLAGIDKELMQRFSKEAVRGTFWFQQLEAIDQELAKRHPEFAKLLKELEELEKERESEGK